MDEILIANFMLFDDVVRADDYDVWIGDEAWEVDFFLHENPELKTAPYVFLTDFVGWLPMDDREARHHRRLQRGEHRARRGTARACATGPCSSASRRISSRTRSGPGLPSIRDWVPRHFDFSGYILPFDPADYADTERLKAELGFDQTRPLLVGAVGGSGVGLPLLRRVAAGLRRAAA